MNIIEEAKQKIDERDRARRVDDAVEVIANINLSKKRTENLESLLNKINDGEDYSTNGIHQF